MDQFPRYFVSSIVFCGASCFSTDYLEFLKAFWEKFDIAIRGYIFNFNRNPVTHLRINSNCLNGSVPKLRVKIDEYAKIRMTLNFSSYIFPISSSRCRIPAQYVDRLFPGAAFAKLSFTCDLFTADSAGDEITSPSAGFAGFGQGDLAIPLQEMQVILPLSISESFSVSLSRLMDLGFPVPLQSGHSFSFRIMVLCLCRMYIQ